MEVEMTGGGESVAPSTPSDNPSTPSTPSAVDLRDDTLVRVPGQQNPVKYGEYYKGFQSQFTRKAQEAAEASRRYQELERKYNEERSAWQRQSNPQATPQNVNPNSQMVEKLRSLPYLNGQEAAEVVEQLAGQFDSFQGALRQRDAVMLALAKHIQQQNQALSGITSKSSMADFEGKTARWAKDIGVPDAMVPRLQELYLAYEGDDLDNEFPTIARKWWDDIQAAVRGYDKGRAEAARKLPFIPGQGGQAGPSKPLNSGFKTAKQITDELWPAMGPTEG